MYRDEQKFIRKMNRLVSTGIVQAQGPIFLNLPSGRVEIATKAPEAPTSDFRPNGWSVTPLLNGGYDTAFIRSERARLAAEGKDDWLAYLPEGFAGNHPTDMMNAYSDDQRANVVGTMQHWTPMYMMFGGVPQMLDEMREDVDAGKLPHWTPLLDCVWNERGEIARGGNEENPTATYKVCVVLGDDMPDSQEVDALYAAMIDLLGKIGPPHFEHTEGGDFR